MSSPDPSRTNRNPIDEQIRQFSLGQFRSMGLLHTIGYGILLLVLMDVFVLLIPPRLMNPTWEFQTFGQCVERLPVLFLGLVLIFIGENNPRAPLERMVVRSLSWATLFLSIIFFLLVPPGIFNTIRIDQANEQTANLELSQRLSQIQQVQNQVEQADSATELQRLSRILRNSPEPPTTASPEDLSNTRQELLAVLQNQEQLLIADSDRDLRNQHRTLVKQSFKWNVGAVIAGTLLALTWVNTRWAR
ncbi:HpsJ-like protein, cyanoexosortase A-associated [Lyngbya confervoides]|uniref:HpsJ family protein n=1 Tax=Lyngbya confervoides BDU141951 TaxID=1574623 RepID=A0ABD4SY34_9CYAN|nr:HpsJ family protein [Lyngbya confervoides]MCM1981263.1 HpsJ family protein [Lyngbya confervoides BDU141951]